MTAGARAKASTEIANGWQRRPFWILAATLTLFLFGASAPSPLYGLYQARFHFSAAVLTTLFAVYALALLATLLIGGRLPDQLGRRPVIIAATLVQLAATVIFIAADGIGALFAARIVQGIATGAATSALSAALVDLQPPRTTLGALVASVAPPAGLAAGALTAGVLVEVAPAPLRTVFWTQLGLLLLALGVVTPLVPESHLVQRAGRLRVAVHLRVPAAARTIFAALSPGLIATWALAGLYLSLGPSLAGVVTGSRSAVVGALVPATLCLATAASSLATRKTGIRPAVVGGSVLLALGVAITLLGIRAGSGTALFAGSLVAGFGFGSTFAGSFRTLAPLASPDERAALLTAVYVVSYLAFSLPAIGAGLAVTRYGLVDSASVYAAAVICLALAAAAASSVRVRQPPNGSGPLASTVVNPTRGQTR